MLTLVANNENLNTISIPRAELEKLGVDEGVKVEISKNDDDEIVLHFVKNDRKKAILNATRDIIERRKSALIELGKGHE